MAAPFPAWPGLSFTVAAASTGPQSQGWSCHCCYCTKLGSEQAQALCPGLKQNQGPAGSGAEAVEGASEAAEGGEKAEQEGRLWGRHQGMAGATGCRHWGQGVEGTGSRSKGQDEVA